MNKIFKVLISVLMTFSLLMPISAEGENQQTETTEQNYLILETNQYYEKLIDAINAVESSQTIQLQKNVDNAIGVSVPSGKDFTLDFNNKTYTITGPGAGSPTTETNAFQLLMNSTIIMKNGTIKYGESVNGVMRMFQSYANVTFDNMDFYTKNQVGSERYAFSFCNGNVVFTGNTNIISEDKNAVSFIAGNFLDYPATHVTFDDNFCGSVNSTIEYSGPNLENYSMNIYGSGSFGKFITTEGDNPEGFKIHSGIFNDRDSALEYLSEDVDLAMTSDGGILAVGQNNVDKLAQDSNTNTLAIEKSSKEINISTGSKPITITNPTDKDVIVNGIPVPANSTEGVVIPGQEPQPEKPSKPTRPYIPSIKDEDEEVKEYTTENKTKACIELLGKGWEYSESNKSCVYTLDTNTQQIPNTSTK